MQTLNSIQPPLPQGLAGKDIPGLQQQYGKNVFEATSSRGLFFILKDLVREPMFLLLLFASLLYFMLGSITEGTTMLVAMMLVSAVSVYEGARSEKALEALKQYTAPSVSVVRDGILESVATSELVPGDLILLQEGDLIPADGQVIDANDLTVDEAIITGESFPVEKNTTPENNLVLQGTTINAGKCTVRVTTTGSRTVLGKLGKSIDAPQTSRTLLQEQVNNTVRRLAVFGVAAFLLICLVNYIKSHDITGSLLLGLTLAMAAIPEEIPVAFSSFIALGAFYMSRMGIICRRPQTIEYLGSMNVLCLDKTGTITENRMNVAMIYDYNADKLTDLEQEQLQSSRVLYYATLASEHPAFDSMEKAIINAYEQQKDVEYMPAMIHEYPLEGRPLMMTHVYPSPQGALAAAKGGPERIMAVCRLDQATMARLNGMLAAMAEKGYRILGVASAMADREKLPAHQDDFNWKLEGFISLYDPPRQNAAQAIKDLYNAGVDVKLLTGDYPRTAIHIAEKTGLKNSGNYISGEEIMKMEETQLQETLVRTNIFARMFPEAKLRVINALKTMNLITGMTGDGVNDGPALKAAHIGIAMGKKGTEIARLAADMVITDDNLANIPEAVRQGRRINNNLKKAIRYIMSIHIPIILTATAPLLLGWKYPVIFDPIHIIFLELIMGPTCSFFFEKEPVETAAMKKPVRRLSGGLFTTGETLITIVQGLVITAGVLGIYHYFMKTASLEVTRTEVFITLVISNIFLTFANRSFTENILHTIRYSNKLAPLIVAISILFIAAIYFIPVLRGLFGIAGISLSWFLIAMLTAFICVFWFEIYKSILFRRSRP